MEVEKEGDLNEGTDNSSKVHAINEVLHFKYSVDEEINYVYGHTECKGR